jgi:hypothetical protein
MAKMNREALRDVMSEAYSIAAEIRSLTTRPEVPADWAADALRRSRENVTRLERAIMDACDPADDDDEDLTIDGIARRAGEVYRAEGEALDGIAERMVNAAVMLPPASALARDLRDQSQKWVQPLADLCHGFADLATADDEPQRHLRAVE